MVVDATAAHCLADEDKNVDLSTLPNMALLRTHFGNQTTPAFLRYEKIGTLEDAVAKWILPDNTDTMGATTVTCEKGPAGGCVDLALVKVKVDSAFRATLRALPVQAAPHWGLGLRGPFDELFCGLGEVEVQAPEHAGPTPEWLRRAGVAS